MPKFSFKAKDGLNKPIEGIRNAASDKDLLMQLRAEGLIVYAVKEVREGLLPKENKRSAARKGGSVKYEDIAVFCRQLATLINAGVSILDAIEDVADMVSSRQFHNILKSIASDVRGGITLSEAMTKHQKVFGRVFISLVATGEKSGQLGKVLYDLAAYLEKSVKLQRKVKSATAYPSFIAGFFFLALAGMILFLVPRFQKLFASFGAELPLPTRIVMAISDAALHNIGWIILLFAGIAVGLTMLLRTRSGRYFVDKNIVTAPVLGPIMTKVVLARFFQTLSTLIRSGTDVVGSLEIAARVADNLYVEELILSIRSKVIEGSTMSAEMDTFELFPRMVGRMTAVGEKSGQLDEMFSKLSDYYSDEVDAIVASMSAIIEPFLIVSLGALVGFFVVVMYLPIFHLAGAVMGGSN
jgi:type IV pilus assembly protein PilC